MDMSEKVHTLLGFNVENAALVYKVKILFYLELL